MSFWFEELFGEKEGDYETVQRRFRVEGDKLISPTGRPFGIGNFSTPSLNELRKEGAKIGKPGRVTVQHVTTTDALELHAQPENRHALFQAASQFNCLEFPSPGSVPESGVSGYAWDNTQGPACALAAAPGTVYRNYFVQVDPEEPERLGQTRDRQINTLRDLEDKMDNTTHKYWRVRNGYVFSDGADTLQKLKSAIDAANRDELLGCIRIGVHRDVEVVYEYRYKQLKNPEAIVSQAYCSALSCSYSGLPVALWEPLATIVLEAAYEATLWAGILNYSHAGCPKVFLTFIGGGVFGNKKEWIAHAICNAVRRIQEAGKELEVNVVHFSRVDTYMERFCAQNLQNVEPDKPKPAPKEGDKDAGKKGSDKDAAASSVKWTRRSVSDSDGEDSSGRPAEP